ncbi:unnamed protein product, partial [Iphiclides podalirius]
MYIAIGPWPLDVTCTRLIVRSQGKRHVYFCTRLEPSPPIVARDLTVTSVSLSKDAAFVRASLREFGFRLRQIEIAEDIVRRRGHLAPKQRSLISSQRCGSSYSNPEVAQYRRGAIYIVVEVFGARPRSRSAATCGGYGVARFVPQPFSCEGRITYCGRVSRNLVHWSSESRRARLAAPLSGLLACGPSEPGEPAVGGLSQCEKAICGANRCTGGGGRNDARRGKRGKPQ